MPNTAQNTVQNTVRKTVQEVVLITGASSGIGAALARVYAEKGCALILLARRMDRLTTLKKACEQLHPECQAWVSTCDVTQREEVERTVREGVEYFGGRLTLVVANAGFAIAGYVEDLEAADFERQFATNVYGVLYLVRATLPHLKGSQGSLALMGSVNSYLALPANAPYCMSKFAVAALAQSLWFELEPHGVSVTLICPGFVASEILQVDNHGQLLPTPKHSVPTWLIMDTIKAARQMERAIRRRRRMIAITVHGKLAILLQRHCPGVLPFLWKWALSRRKKINFSSEAI